MSELTTGERFKRMYEHREADRVPIVDSPWTSTLERWHREGLPEGADWRAYFGVDVTGGIEVDNSPRFPETVLQETDTYRITTTRWGATEKNWKHASSTPEHIDYVVKDRKAWEAAKARMTPTPNRIDWQHLKQNYPTWRAEGRWIGTGLWFGFDITHARVVGTERLLVALYDDPEWCVDMFNHALDVGLALLDQVWDAGYTFHGFAWPDDLGYKNAQFMSLAMYRELVKPVHRRACDWAHAKGVKAYLHSCGNVNPFIPDFIDAGVDALNPLEVKAGMDPIAIKKRYGDRLVLAGGINVVLWDQPEAIAAEMRRVIPVLKRGGGYIFSSDHSIPDSVGLEDFRRIVALAKELGKY
jgi:uroporphyrinogen decarboxylase